MSKIAFFFLLVILVTFSGRSQSTDIKDPIPSHNQQVDVARGNAVIQGQHIAFVENKGQIKQIDGSNASFVSHLLQRGNTNIYLLKEGGIAYQFNKLTYPARYKELMMADLHGDSKAPELLLNMKKDIRLETYRMDMHLKGANPNAQILNEGKQFDYFNFYNHNVVEVYHYEKVTYLDIYPDIDWVIYTNEDGFKYDFVVHPGADPSQIQLTFSHHEELQIDEAGNLIHSNRLGCYKEKAPVSFQGGKTVKTHFLLQDDEVSFELEEYDTARILTIDPERIWGTYYGGNSDDFAHFCATDNSGNVYLAGRTSSILNIAEGGYQNTLNGGSWGDAFLAKFDSDGERQWATYYGGNDDDSGLSCTVDEAGRVYMSGQTQSNSGIASNGHQNNYGGGTMDAFLVKFNSNGTRSWATYYGGELFDRGRHCAVDSSGNVYLVGTTRSMSNIALNGHQPNNGGNGNDDAFIVKFNSDGERQWATYYGGANGEYGHSCSVSGPGDIYMAGYTGSFNGISMGGFQMDFGGGTEDAFLVKFNSNGVRQWSTYFGGNDSDLGFSCATDKFGNIFLAGETRSTSDIASGGHQVSFGGGPTDSFLAKFNPEGLLQWSTYYGGSNQDRVWPCVVDSHGNVYIAGTTGSSSEIAFEGYQTTYGGGSEDAFLAKFYPNGILQWSTYYGDEDIDYGQSCAIDNSGNIYMAGYTQSTSNIASGGHQNTFGGGWGDAYLVKFESGCNPTSHTIDEIACDTILYNGQAYTESGIYLITLTNAAGCDSIVTLNLTINNSTTGTDIVTACDSYNWIDGITYTSDNTSATHILTSSTGCDSIVTLNLTINNSTTVTDEVTTCDSITWIDGNTYTSNNNSAEYLLTNSLGCDSLIKLDLIINNSTSAILTETACDSIYLNGQTFTESGTYTQLLNNAAGCDSVITLNLTINNVSDVTTTIDGIALYANNSSATYQWVDCNNENAPIVGETNQLFTPHGNGSYAVILTENGCSAISDCQDITTVSVENSELSSLIIVFPNPTSGIFHVNFPEVLLGHTMVLTDIHGKEMREVKINATTVQLDISEFSNGIYFIKIAMGDDFLTRKLIKQ